MSATAQLRAVVAGLIAFAAAEEEMLLASAASDIADSGNERRWGAAPNQVAGMAAYSLACAQAASGRAQVAARTLAEAISLNPDVRANASREPDLESLRGSGRLSAILAD